MQLIKLFPSERQRHLMDEVARAAFAPEEARLGVDFAAHSETLELFLDARGSLSAGAEQLAIWVQGAKTAEGQRAVMRYLVKGELRDEVVDQLQRRGPLPPWCTLKALRAFALEENLVREIGGLEVALGLSTPAQRRRWDSPPFRRGTALGAGL